MNCQQTASGKCHTYHRVANAEFTGVFIAKTRDSGDYHLFIKYGDKVYMEAKGVGEVVISFDKLQKYKQWKHWKQWKQYYDLSLLLTNDKHLVVEDLKYNSDYCERQIYEERRIWSIDTSFIENNEVISIGDVCYYNINPFDLEKMEYTSKEDLDIFKNMYKNTIDEELEIYIELAKAIKRN